MSKEHAYSIYLDWEGNRGDGTSSYGGYGRAHKINAPNKNSIIEGSSDPAFHGDPKKYNPEELLLSSIASCHMLWYLHLCTTEKIIVTSYKDNPRAEMHENADGSGQFEFVLLKPVVTIRNSGNKEKAMALHVKAHEMCFIARSCNFRIDCEASIRG